MLDFDKYVARHGEIGVQAIIEQFERYEGIRNNYGTSLEDRWIRFIEMTSEQQLAA